MQPPQPRWTEPGAFPVGPGVYRIPLPLPQDGLRAVNVYAIVEADSVVLIDGGWAPEASERALSDALAILGCELGDISRFLITHVHRDHYTQAVALRRKYGMPISLGDGERYNLDAMVQAAESARDIHQRGQLLRAGAAELVRQRDLEQPTELDLTDWEAPDTYLSDRTELRAGSLTLQAIATPGHTRGHLVYRDETAGLLFAGDHVLPHITPSLGYEAAAEDGVLSNYLSSLRLLLALPDTRLLPAHGEPGASVHDRVGELLEHHDRRLTDCLNGIGRGHSTAYQLAGALGWTRHERPFDSLDLFNRCLAVNETTAHLEVLAQRGLLAVCQDDGVDSYHPS